jgi:beta-lactamase regulating signal transducer with metallopeptidase domain
MGCLWIVMQLIVYVFKPSAKIQFMLAGFIQFTSTIVFILSIINGDIYANKLLDAVYNYSIIIHPNITVLILLGIFYFVGLFIYIGSFLFNLIQLQALKQSGNYDSQENWMQLLNATNVKIPANIKIGLSNKVSTPLVFGFFEPVILLPIAICTQLSNQEIKLILLHEIAHLIRKDYLVNLLISFSKTILWFNPFSYIVTQKIDLLREMACDELVLKYSNEPILYSKALYHIASIKQMANPVYVLAAINGNEHALMTRIKNINKIKVKATGISIVTSVCILLISTLLIVGLFKQPVLVRNNIAALVTNKKSENIIKNKYSIITPTKLEVVSVKMKLRKSKQITQTENIQKDFASNTKTEYDELLAETRNWIKQRENPNQLANYSNTIDSIENVIAERLFMSSIIKSYQLKRSIIEQMLSKAHDNNEAIDYLMNSKEWNDILEYEKWAKEYLGRHQQPTSLAPPTTKQQIQYR